MVDNIGRDQETARDPDKTKSAGYADKSEFIGDSDEERAACALQSESIDASNNSAQFIDDSDDVKLRKSTKAADSSR